MDNSPVEGEIKDRQQAKAGRCEDIFNAGWDATAMRSDNQPVILVFTPEPGSD